MEGNLRAGQNNKLRKLRQRQKWPQWAVAVQTRISPATLSTIERWGYKPGVELQERIATALGVDVADISPEVSHE
jgi:DNA-binding XRE family transcriptional regulator